MTHHDHAKAAPKAMVTHGHARFTVLTDRMVRLEYAEDGIFEDRATLAVINRRTPPPAFTTKIRGDQLTIQTGALVIRYTENGRGFTRNNLAIRLRAGGNITTWHPGKKDRHNLGGTVRTLDGAEGDQMHLWKQNEQGHWIRHGKAPIDLGHGFISRSGWAVFDDSRSVVLAPRPDAFTPWAVPRAPGKRQDLYFFGHGHDYKGALIDAAKVFGGQPLPPRFALGYWYSRYWAYTDRELLAITAQFKQMNLPLDVMVIDMDWHLPGWTGYTWDRDYFPDPDALLRELRRQGVKITLNLHPADGVGAHEAAFAEVCRDLGRDPKTTTRIPFDGADPVFMASYFKRLHHPEEERGVDFWWLDWQQGATTAIENLDPLPWLNHLHWQDQIARRPQRRPINFSRYGGPGSGRYPVGFSGDTHSTWDSLAYQPYFTATAANVLYGTWSHDIGGHQPGPIDGELFTRWIQFGVFSPILRTHTSKNRDAERRVWLYPEPFRDIMMDALRLRYRMIPYVYSELRAAYETSVSLCRPLYIEHPGHEEAYQQRHAYYFGQSMIVAPVTRPADSSTGLTEQAVWLPPGRWYDLALGRLERGGAIRRSYLLDEIPVFVPAGAVIPEQSEVTRLEHGSYPDITVHAYPGGDGRYVLYEDDGWSEAYRNKEFSRIPIEHHYRGDRRTVRIGAARGRFSGFRPRRPVTVRFHGSAPPREVRVNGKTAEWRFDGDRGIVIVSAGLLDLTRANRIELTTQPALDRAFSNGWSGTMRRMARIAALANLVSPAHPMHPQERLAIRLGQTGNRLSRNPDLAAETMTQHRKDAALLPKALEEFQTEYRLRNDAGAVAILQKARDLLAAII